MSSRPALVAVESPYAANGPFSVADHEAYARLAMSDSLRRGEAPFLSHLLYTQVLADTIPYQRAQGMAAGAAWSAAADYAVAYIDLGVTPGMEKQITHYVRSGRWVEYRSLFWPTTQGALSRGEMSLQEAIKEAIR